MLNAQMKKKELDVLCRAIQMSFLSSRNSSSADIVPHRNWISRNGIKIRSIKSLLKENSRKAITNQRFFSILTETSGVPSRNWRAFWKID